MRQVFGGLLLGCGILVAGLSGLCTLVMAGMTFFDPSAAGDFMTIVVALAIFGGFPFVCGLGLFFAGRSLLRERAGAAYGPPPAAPPGRLDPAALARPDRTRDDSNSGGG